MEVEVRSPFPFEALPRIWGWIETFKEKVTDDFSPKTVNEFVASMAEKWARQRSWAIYSAGELGGLVTYEELTPWVGTAHFLLKPEFQRRGLSVRAARQVAAQIFTEERIGKLVFYPLAGNLAIGSLLINIGARREGTLSGHTLAGGKPIDLWVYGLMKEEFKYAGECNSSGNRGVELDHRGDSRREAKNPDQHHHSNTHARDAAAPGPALAVLDGQHQ